MLQGLLLLKAFKDSGGLNSGRDSLSKNYSIEKDPEDVL